MEGYTLKHFKLALQWLLFVTLAALLAAVFAAGAYFIEGKIIAAVVAMVLFLAMVVPVVVKEFRDPQDGEYL